MPPLSKGQALSHYFPFMTYVMNAQNVMDQSDIFTIAFMWGDSTQIYELTKAMGDSEKKCHDVIRQLLKR